LGAWQSEAPWYADDLALARLDALERQGRFREYLHLASSASSALSYLNSTL
jgi:hypothetical protein